MDDLHTGVGRGRGDGRRSRDLDGPKGRYKGGRRPPDDSIGDDKSGGVSVRREPSGDTGCTFPRRNQQSRQCGMPSSELS
ncbi:hypothetical protein R0J87_22825, partial [Halomonas sp. SIMBA_159]